MKKTRIMTICFLLIIFTFVITGCGSENDTSAVDDNVEIDNGIVEEDETEVVEEESSIKTDKEEDYIIENFENESDGYIVNYPQVKNMKDKEREERLNGQLGNKSCMVVENENGDFVPEFINYEVTYKGSEVLSIIYTDSVVDYGDDYFYAYNYTMKSNTGLLFGEMLFDLTDEAKVKELVEIFNSKITVDYFKFTVDNFWGIGIYFEQLDSGFVDVVIYFYASYEDDEMQVLHIPLEEVREYFTDEYKYLEFK